MQELYLCLSIPEEHFSPSGKELNPSVIIKGLLSDEAKLGRNTLLFSPGIFEAKEVFYKDSNDSWKHVNSKGMSLDFNFFTNKHHQLSNDSYKWLSQVIPMAEEKTNDLHPFICIVPKESEMIIYHHMAVGKRGSLYVAYEWLSPIHKLQEPEQVVNAIEVSKEKWKVARRSFNNNCWYTKWRSDVEIERKYTFTKPVDTWVLIQKLYHSILSGELNEFVPEFNDEFQVWDFENYMFEILEPQHKRGYVSFIPQSNGLMTVKQKNFEEDAEIRSETITAHVKLALDEIEEYAKSFGQVRALPHYRRKRFDVNLESLKTGNVYGIFFDLCRPIGDEVEGNALFQCEVEYIRSRVMAPVHEVMEEYEKVCSFTKEFLLNQKIEFNEGYYSKLSYLRDYTKKFKQKEHIL